MRKQLSLLWVGMAIVVLAAPLSAAQPQFRTWEFVEWGAKHVALNSANAATATFIDRNSHTVVVSLQHLPVSHRAHVWSIVNPPLRYWSAGEKQQQLQFQRLDDENTVHFKNAAGEDRAMSLQSLSLVDQAWVQEAAYVASVSAAEIARQRALLGLADAEPTPLPIEDLLPALQFLALHNGVSAAEISSLTAKIAPETAPANSKPARLAIRVHTLAQLVTTCEQIKNGDLIQDPKSRQPIYDSLRQLGIVKCAPEELPVLWSGVQSAEQQFRMVGDESMADGLQALALSMTSGLNRNIELQAERVDHKSISHEFSNRGKQSLLIARVRPNLIESNIASSDLGQLSAGVSAQLGSVQAYWNGYRWNTIATNAASKLLFSQRKFPVVDGGYWQLISLKNEFNLTGNSLDIRMVSFLQDLQAKRIRFNSSPPGIKRDSAAQDAWSLAASDATDVTNSETDRLQAFALLVVLYKKYVQPVYSTQRDEDKIDSWDYGETLVIDGRSFLNEMQPQQPEDPLTQAVSARLDEIRTFLDDPANKPPLTDEERAAREEAERIRKELEAAKKKAKAAVEANAAATAAAVAAAARAAAAAKGIEDVKKLIAAEKEVNDLRFKGGELRLKSLEFDRRLNKLQFDRLNDFVVQLNDEVDKQYENQLELRREVSELKEQVAEMSNLRVRLETLIIQNEEREEAEWARGSRVGGYAVPMNPLPGWSHNNSPYRYPY